MTHLLTAFKQPLAIVDLETTGGRALQDRITEIGVILVDEGSIREWSTLVNPGCRISAFITQLTGISDDVVKDAPSFADIADELRELLKGRLFIAHNARFDYGFIKAEFERLGEHFQARTLCTVRVSRALSPEQARHNLDSVMAAYGIEADNRHRALDDARAVLEFLLRAEALHGIETLAAATAVVKKRPTLPPYLDESLVDALPVSPGVYFFHGEAGLLYVGKAKCIRSRVLGHFTTDVTSAKEMRLSQQVRRITWETTAGELGALLREARYVKSLQPLHNRQLRRQSRLSSIVLVPRTDGTEQPKLVSGRELEANSRLYGLFASRAAMTKYLRTLSVEYGLCDHALGLERAAKRPCTSRQLKRCKGLCEGAESPVQHNIRLREALESQALLAWPFKGWVALEEHDRASNERELHLINNWCWIGSAKDQAGLDALLEAAPQPVLDKDTYRLLVKAVFGKDKLKVHHLAMSVLAEARSTT